MKTKYSDNQIIILFFLFLTAVRFSLLGSGTFTFPDESRYLVSFSFIKNIFSYEWAKAFQDLGSTDARPGDVLFRAFSALLQILFEALFSLPVLSKKSLFIPTGMNLLFSLLNSFFIYKISLKILNKNYYSICSSACYSLLTNSNLYIRHISPHDYILCIFMFLIYYFYYFPKKINLLYYGIASAFIVTAYPGFYAAPLIIGSLVLIPTHEHHQKINKKKIFAYLIGVLIPFFIFQILTFKNSTPYFNQAFLVKNAQSLDQEGSFNEGFSFIFKYFLIIERSAGIFILLGSLSYFYVRICAYFKKIKSDSLTALDVLAFSLLFTYFFHALMTSVFHQFMFYGRLLHFYMPIMVLLTMQACLTLLNHFLRKIFVFTFTLSSFIGFIIFFKDFTTVQYPMDLLNQINIKFNTAHFISEFEKCETNGLLPNESSMKQKSGEFVLVNFCRPYPLKEKKIDFKNFSLIIQIPHFIEFKPYQFEGFSKEERDMFSKKHYFMSIYTVL